MKLRDWLPDNYFDADVDKQAAKYLDVEVDHGFGGLYESSKKWPGGHKNVICWCRLVNGYAVGFNENPSRGYSFPVVKLKV